ncbi:MAG: VOC family protein [Hyphomicrobiaceae bacterium]
MSDGSILPVVRYKNPAAAAQWLCRAYGFCIHHEAHGPDGEIAHVVLRYGNDFVLIGPPSGTVFDGLMVQPVEVGNRSTQACYLTIADVDAHCAEARKVGARIEIEPCDDDGGRYYMCRDLDGHLWSFGNASHGAKLSRREHSPETHRQRPGAVSRTAISLAILVGLALGGSATLYFGAEPTQQAMASRIGGTGQRDELRDDNARISLARDLRSEAERFAAFATKRLADAEAIAVELKEKLDATRSQVAETLRQKQVAEQALYLSEIAHTEQTNNNQKALDAAVQAKDQASRALLFERQRALEAQTALDHALQKLAGEDTQRMPIELARLKDANLRSEQAVALASAQLAAAQSAEAGLREKLDGAERHLNDLRLRATELEGELKAARLGAEKAAEAAKGALAAAQSNETALRSKLHLVETELAALQASRSKQSTKIARLEGAKPDIRPMPKASENGAQSACSRAVRDIALKHHQGTEAWQSQIANQLCEGTNATQEPAKCVAQLLAGKVDWGGGTQWKVGNAVRLCARSQNSAATLTCFSRQVAAKGSWQGAIAACSST